MSREVLIDEAVKRVIRSHALQGDVLGIRRRHYNADVYFDGLVAICARRVPSEYCRIAQERSA